MGWIWDMYFKETISQEISCWFIWLEPSILNRLESRPRVIRNYGLHSNALLHVICLSCLSSSKNSKMATFSCIASKSFSPSLYPSHPHQSNNASFPFTSRSTSVRFPGELRQRGIRGVSVVTRAGPPSTNQFIFAFAFPLSLLAFTVFTAIQIGNRLDQKFLEEVYYCFVLLCLWNCWIFIIIFFNSMVFLVYRNWDFISVMFYHF